MTFDVNLPVGLNSQTVTTSVSTVTVPPPSVMLARPLSYQFQVVEYVDKDDKVIKVELQVQKTEHDNYGNVFNSSGFQPVPRIKLPLP
jgi:hypothetical protein